MSTRTSIEVQRRTKALHLAVEALHEHDDATRRADAARRSALRRARAAGVPKVDLAAALGIGRPTLDRWLGE